MPIVLMSQKAINSFARLPPNIQSRARRAFEYLRVGDEKSIKPFKLKEGRNLYHGRLTDKYRIIYSKSQNSITIVDFINIEDVSQVMRSDE